jgi:hypothetical protein
VSCIHQVRELRGSNDGDYKHRRLPGTCVVWYTVTDVSEKIYTSIFRENIRFLETSVTTCHIHGRRIPTTVTFKHRIHPPSRSTFHRNVGNDVPHFRASLPTRQ